MTLLFSSKPWPAAIKGIFTATRTHALNLAKFVTIYKVMLLLQRRVNGGKERDLDSLVAGGLGGWWVFGDRTPVC
jgi:peroxisomal membrane protein 4